MYLRHNKARHGWLTPVILAAQEAEIKRIKVQPLAGQIVPNPQFPKNQKKKKKKKKGWWSGFKPQYWEKKERHGYTFRYASHCP
jgi:hypothetical protein